MARALTEKQQKLLAVLFDEAGGDIITAKKLAGYSDATSSTEILGSLKEEILDATSTYPGFIDTNTNDIYIGRSAIAYSNFYKGKISIHYFMG